MFHLMSNNAGIVRMGGGGGGGGEDKEGRGEAGEDISLGYLIRIPYNM